MATIYSSAAAVKTRCGVTHGDLGLDDDAALVTFLEELLGEVSDLADRHMGVSYLAEDPVPAGLAGVVADAATDSLRTMIATRQTPIQRIDDFAVRVIRAQTLSKDVMDRLALYAAGAGVRSVDLGQDAISDTAI